MPLPQRLPAPLALAAIALALAFSPASASPQGTWLRIGDPPNPPVFQSHAAAYDSVGDRLLVYMPYHFVNSNPVGSDDIWEFRLSMPDSGWRQIATFGTGPMGMTNPSVVFDQVNRNLLLFGGWPGYPGSDPMTTKLWKLSFAGTPTWSVVPTGTDTLRVRFDAFMCLDDSTRSLVLYGGTAFFGDHYRPVNDAWTLPIDSATPDWSVVPTSNPPPPERYSPQVAWDAQRRRVLVHGGVLYTAYGTLTETWALTLGDPGHWDPLATTGPQIVRANGGALVDRAGDRLLLAPGTSNFYPPPANERYVYQLPLAPGGEWSLAPAADSFDVSPYRVALAHDTRRERMVTIGGVLTHAFSMTDGSGWQRLWPPDPVRSPETITGNVLVSDAAHQAIWSVGGTEQSGFGDLWKLDASADALWSWYPQPSPMTMSGHAAALDAAGQRILVTRLDSQMTQVIALTTAGTPAQTVWTPADTFPPYRVDESAIVDPVRQRLIVFGGQYFGPHFGGTSFDDLWSVPFSNLSAWTPLTPAPGPAPSGRGAQFAFYDDVNDRMVMIGGWQQSGGPIRHYQHDAWALSLADTPTWTKLDSAAWNPPVFGRLTYDPVDRRLFLFHASVFGSPSATVVYTRGIADSDTWSVIETGGDAPDVDAPIAFAPWCDRLVVVSTNGDGPQDDETWALQVDHVVAALASLESVDASPELVSIAWRIGGSNGAPVTLSRRAADGTWQVLGDLLPDGEGRVAYDDRDVTAGTLLTYRLSDGAHTLIETAVRVPLRTALSFAGARPAPARGAAHLAYALPAAEPVTLELYDVRGARVLTHDLGVQPAGEHEWTWRETASLRPGLYLARLIAGTNRRDAKVLLLP